MRREHVWSIVIGLTLAVPAMSSGGWKENGQTPDESPLTLACTGINGDAKILEDWQASSTTRSLTSTDGVVGANWHGTSEAACPPDTPAPSGPATLVHNWKRTSGSGTVGVQLTSNPISSGGATVSTVGPWQWSPVITITDAKPVVVGADSSGEWMPIPLDDTSNEYESINMSGAGGTPGPGPVSAETQANGPAVVGNIQVPQPPPSGAWDGSGSSRMIGTTGSLGQPLKFVTVTYTVTMSGVTETASNANVQNWRIATKSTLVTTGSD